MNETQNSFEQSSYNSDDDSLTSVEDISESFARADQMDSRIEQINPSDLVNYNNLIEQFNYGN